MMVLFAELMREELNLNPFIYPIKEKDVVGKDKCFRYMNKTEAKQYITI